MTGNRRPRIPLRIGLAFVVVVMQVLLPLAVLAEDRAGAHPGASLIQGQPFSSTRPDNAPMQVAPGLPADRGNLEPTANPLDSIVIVIGTDGISVTKGDTPDPVNAGQDLFYDIYVVNNEGGESATNVVVTDTLPAQVQYVSDTAGCNATSLPLLVCNLPDIAPFGQGHLQIKVQVPADAVASESDGTLAISNTATASARWPTATDPFPADNTSVQGTFIQDLADLQVTKISEPHGVVRAGEIFTYTIFVDNLGPSVSRHAVITDTLLNSSLVSIQSCAFSVSQGGGAITQFTCTTGPVVSTQFGSDIGTFATNRLDPLTRPSQGRLRASFRLVALETLDVMNTTRVSAATPDPDMSNNLTTDSISVEATADVQVTKTATGEEQQVNQTGLIFNNAIFGQVFPTAPNYFASTRVTAGRRILYTLNALNNGPSTAENVVLSDRLPAGVRLYQGSLTAPAGVTCQTGIPGEPLDRLTCGLGTLARGAGKTVSFQVVVDGDVLPGTVLENDALVSSHAFDPDNGNNYANTQNTVLAAADMKVVKTSTGQVVVGYDPALKQPIVEDQTNHVTAGMLLRYGVTVQNNGPSTAYNATVSDALPAGVSFVRADGATCRPNDVAQSQVYCSVGTMEAGERRTFDIYVRVDPQALEGTVLANCATVLSSPSNTSPPGPPPNPPTGGPTMVLTWDPETADNQACVNTTAHVRADSADLGIVKTDDPDPVSAGGLLTYTLTISNAGPAPAYGLVVEDNLPAEVRVTSVSRSSLMGLMSAGPREREVVAEVISLSGVSPLGVASCSAGTPGDPNDPTTCTFDSLAVGASATMTVVVRVRPDVLPEGVTEIIIHNDVSVRSDVSDPSLDNNTYVEETHVQAARALLISKIADRSHVLAGQYIQYAIVVTNTGATTAENVQLLDTLDGGAQYLTLVQSNVDGGTGSCTYLDLLAPPRVKCNLGNLNPAAVRWIDLRFLVDPGTRCGVAFTDTVGINTAVNPTLSIDAASDITEAVTIPCYFNYFNYVPLVVENWSSP